MELRRRDGGVTAVEVAGRPEATPVLLCHGLAESRLAMRRWAPAAQELGWRVIVPDRPGSGRSDPRRLDRLADWVEDATGVLDELGLGAAYLVGISGGGAFAAACAALAPDRFPRLTLVTPLGPPAWPTAGMAPWQRRSLRLATRSPGFGGRFLHRLAGIARRSPGLYFRIATSEMPAADRRALADPEIRADFRISYLEAFRQGGGGVTQDLRLLTRPWGFELGDIAVPAAIHHGDVDTTVPLQHARRYAAAIPGATLTVYPGHGHFSIPARSGRFAAQPGTDRA